MPYAGSYPPPYANGVNGHATEGNDYDNNTTTAGLKSLQSSEEKRLFDIVDRLRSLDINHELDLPQLVVCGGQSSGKSSVLEAISQLDFPRADMTCTRFASEIQFRRGDTEHLQIEIIPDKARDPAEQKRLREVKFATKDLKQLANIIKEADKRMGVSDSQGFAKDVLKVQITGPNYQPLTLVDLPGLIETHSQGRQHIKMVSEIVDDWIKEKRSIILAVVEANSDPQRQGILTRAKEMDPSGERTFGIITKPDLPEADSPSQWFWIEHAQNLPNNKAEFSFKKGWHVLRNRKFSERDSSTGTRDVTEKQFFQDPKNNWHVVNQQYWGIETLRKRLQTLLYEHTKKQLPQVRRDVTTKLNRYTEELRNLDARLQKPDQLWGEYQRECQRLLERVILGVHGSFKDALYSDYDGPAPQSVRSRIQEAADIFAREMIENGHGIAGAGPENVLSGDLDDYFLEVKNMVNRTRGEELPGLTDPQRLSILFWKHSMPWKGIAESHINRAYGHCEDFVRHMIVVDLQARLPNMPKAVCHKMIQHLERSLEAQKDFARKELGSLEEDRKRAPQTRNVAFVQRSERKRAENSYLSTMRTVASEEGGMVNGDSRMPRMTPASHHRAFGQDASDVDAENLGTKMLIYYDIARDVFVDNVLVQVIERHLLAPLNTLFHGNFDIDQATFYDMLNDQDTQELENQKRELESKISMLKACQAELM